MNDEYNSSLVCRMIVQFCLGLYKWDVGEREAAAASYREILRKGQNATWRDRMLKIVNSDSISGIPNEISGTVIDEIMETNLLEITWLNWRGRVMPYRSLRARRQNC